MNNSSECAGKSTATADLLRGCDVEFPVEPGFVSKPPHIDPEAMFKRCEEMLPYHLSQVGFWERWRADKIDVEFVL